MNQFIIPLNGEKCKGQFKIGEKDKFRFIVHLSIEFVGAIINRLSNYLRKNNWDFRRKSYIIAFGDGILFLNITGRIISAPTDSNELLIDKSESAKKTCRKPTGLLGFIKLCIPGRSSRC